MEVPQQVVEETIEVVTSPGEEEANEQMTEDQEFLASLMNKIEDPEEKTPEVEEGEGEKNIPVSDPATPDFDPDDVMFK